jgi:hypothetical protein
MQYPNPEPEQRFWYDKKYSRKIEQKNSTRKKINPHVKNLLKIIQKYDNIYASLPFVTHIYLCNSLTFNAADENSDIDLTFIVQDKRLWTARLYSVLFFRLSGIKRTSKHTKQRFCLSFYLTHNHSNIYNIKRPHTDIYLHYRLIHTIPYYIAPGHNPHHLIQNNQRIQATLKNHPQYHTVRRDKKENHTCTKQTNTKKILQKIHQGRRGDIVEYMIKIIWFGIISRKKKRLGKKQQHIIVSDTMLKFYHDKRDIFQDIIKISKNQ